MRNRGCLLLALSLFLLSVRPAKAVTTDRLARSDRSSDLPAGSEQTARFDRLMPSDGLSFPEVRSIVQDSQGYMWFATTGGGLNRYDGYDFTYFRNDPGDPGSLPFDDVWALYSDSDGVLWIGGAGGLARFEHQTDSFDHIDTFGQVYTIGEDQEGLLWAGFWHGLYAYDRASGEIELSFRHRARAPDETTIARGNVYAIHEDKGGHLWIGTSSGLDRLDRATGTFNHFRYDRNEPTSLSDNSVRSIFEDSTGRLWIGTAGGLNLMDRATDTFSHFTHDPADPTSLSHDVINAILEDRQGDLWIATFDGLERMVLTDKGKAGRVVEDAIFVHHRHDPFDLLSLSDDTVYALYEDRSGVLWAGTGEGLSKYNRRASQIVRYQTSPAPDAADSAQAGNEALSELGADLITAFHEDGQGMLWIGGTKGRLYSLDPQSEEFTVYRRESAGSDGESLTAILEDTSGALWIGTDQGRISLFDRDSESFVAKRRFMAGVSGLVEDADENLWIGTWGDGLYRLGPERVELDHFPHYWDQPDHWRQFGSLSSHIIQSLHLDHEGQVWIGTYSGGVNLWSTDEESFSHYRHDPENPNSLGHDRVLAFCEDPDSPDEIMWLGTMGGGLNRLDRATGTFTRYADAEGLAGDSVGCILPDHDGFLWLSTIQGLSRFDPRNETFTLFDRRDGIPSLARTCFQSSDGAMYFGTSQGFFTFQPELVALNTHIPPVVLTDFSLRNQSVRKDLAHGEHIDLSYQDNSLSFEYAALDYTAPEKNRYAYRLDGMDDEWVYAGDRRRAEYTNIPPGDYTFRVKGSNNDGVWNEEGLVVSISIAPPFWQTWWFRGVMLLVVAAAFAIGYRLRVRSLEARSRRLEEEVEERTAELVAANEALASEIDVRAQAEEALAQERAAAAVAAERGRLARDLHDAVTQTLFSASLIAEVLPRLWAKDPETGRQQLEDVRLLTRGALAEMRTLLLELRPEALTEAEMSELLKQLGRAISGRCGIAVAVELDEVIRLPPDAQIAFYRIAQEGLNNVVKHADASQMTVKFASREGWARLIIRDDGRGFDANAISADHFGLQIMRERAEAIGAQLTIVSQPDEGTEITVEWSERPEEKHE